VKKGGAMQNEFIPVVTPAIVKAVSVGLRVICGCGSVIERVGQRHNPPGADFGCALVGARV
jgi:hypothetical protein